MICIDAVEQSYETPNSRTSRPHQNSHRLHSRVSVSCLACLHEQLLSLLGSGPIPAVHGTVLCAENMRKLQLLYVLISCSFKYGLLLCLEAPVSTDTLQSRLEQQIGISPHKCTRKETPTLGP